MSVPGKVCKMLPNFHFTFSILIVAKIESRHLSQNNVKLGCHNSAYPEMLRKLSLP